MYNKKCYVPPHAYSNFCAGQLRTLPLVGLLPSSDPDSLLALSCTHMTCFPLPQSYRSKSRVDVHVRKTHTLSPPVKVNQ
jgi:hypothetical protein